MWAAWSWSSSCDLPRMWPASTCSYAASVAQQVLLWLLFVIRAEEGITTLSCSLSKPSITVITKELLYESGN